MPDMEFCARQGGCSCPDGSPSPASDYPPLPQGVSYLGAADPNAGGAITVTGIALDQVCKEKPTRDRGDGGGGRGGGGGPRLELHALNENGASLVGGITSGRCSFSGNAFTAKGSGSGYRFEMRIAGAKRPGTYAIPIGASPGTYVRVKGGAGSFSGQFSGLNGGTGGAGTAVIVPRPVRVGKRIVTRYRIIVGITPLFAGGKPGLAVVPGGGGLAC